LVFCTKNNLATLIHRLESQNEDSIEELVTASFNRPELLERPVNLPVNLPANMPVNLPANLPVKPILGLTRQGSEQGQIKALNPSDVFVGTHDDVSVFSRVRTMT
jgi:hypothetical protein